MDDTFLSLLFTSTLSLLFPHFLYLVYRNVKTLFTVFFSLLFAALQTSRFYCSASAFPFAVPYSVVLWKCFSLSVISVYYLFSDLSILFLFFLLFFIFSQNMFLLSENLAQNPFFPYASFRAVPCSSAALWSAPAPWSTQILSCICRNTSPFTPSQHPLLSWNLSCFCRKPSPFTSSQRPCSHGTCSASAGNQFESDDVLKQGAFIKP